MTDRARGPMAAMRLLLLALVVLAGCGAPAPPLHRIVPSAPTGELAVDAVASPGPVPDFAPMGVIATHEDLSEMAPGPVAGAPGAARAESRRRGPPPSPGLRSRSR